MIKKKTFVLLFVMVSAFTMTSCISIVEKVLFKKDGGGTYSMTLDMSQIASMMAAFSEGDNEMSQAFDEMNDDFEASRAKLERVRGVSNVRQELDKETLILTLLFDFEDVDALNRGMSEYYHDEEEGAVQQHVFFTQDRKSITRTEKDVIGESLKKEMASDEDEEVDLSMILADMYHETVLEFERDIKSFSNDNYRKDGNRVVRWRKYLFNKRDADRSLSVKVTTK